MKKLLTVDDISILTGWASMTIYRKARQGKIPSVKLGHSLRFEAEEIEKWITKMKLKREILR